MSKAEVKVNPIVMAYERELRAMYQEIARSGTASRSTLERVSAARKAAQPLLAKATQKK